MPVYGEEPVVNALRGAMKSRVPTMLVGEPGVGKTAVIEVLTEEMGYELITLLGSSMEPTDFAGLPSPSTLSIEDEEVPVTAYLAPYWAAETMLKKKVVIFLDEFRDSPIAVQSAFQTFIQSRRFADGRKVPKETIIIGAMNPITSATNPNELSLPMSNRITFLPWITSHESWYLGMLDDWGASVSPAESSWRKKIVAFLKERPFLLHKKPDARIDLGVYGVKPDDEVSTEIARIAWPSRRSWDNLAKLLATSSNATYIQDTLAQGTVGWEAAQEFRAWLQENDNGLSVDEVLRNPQAIDWDGVGLNEAATLFRALTEILSPKTVAPVLKVVKIVLDSGNYGILGPYYQEIFKRATDQRVVGEDNAKKALQVVRQLLVQLSPLLGT